MNPAHTGFIFMDVLNPFKQKAELRIADPGMKIAIDKYVRGAPKDFFYVMVRDAAPPKAEGISWVPDSGAQPPPAWMTGIFSAKLAIGNVDVELLRFEKGHVAFRVRAGSKEPGAWGAKGVKLSLDEKEAHEVLAAVGLGHTTDSTRYGLSFAGATPVQLRTSYASLIANPRGEVRLVTSGVPELGADEDAVQLPLLVQAGDLSLRARDRGELRTRGALCVAPDGASIVATARHDSSDAVATALMRVGCLDVVELDRGSHHPAFVQRGGQRHAADGQLRNQRAVRARQAHVAARLPLEARRLRAFHESDELRLRSSPADDEKSRKKRKLEREQREREKAGMAGSDAPAEKPETAAHAEQGEPQRH